MLLFRSSVIYFDIVYRGRYNPVSNYSYISVMTNQSFYPGLCALNYSLKRVSAKYPLKVVVPDDISHEVITLIENLHLEVIKVPNLTLPDEIQQLNSSQRWNQTFFKLQIFNLVQFDKIVFLDLDMIVVQNIDELFEKPHMAAVAAGYCAHSTWTRLNSGLMVIEPGIVFYRQLIDSIVPACKERLSKSLGYGDQDVINYCIPDWWERKELVLPEIYNAVIFDFDKVCRAYNYSDLCVIHYAENRKPWNFAAWRMIRHIIYSFLKGKVNRAKMCCKYWWYVAHSCPDYLKYSWH